MHGPEGISADILDMPVLVHLQKRLLIDLTASPPRPLSDPGLELFTLIYLRNASPHPVAGEMIGLRDLKDSHFFQGPHELDTRPVIERYGRDPAGFREACLRLKGIPLAGADEGFTLRPFPKIPVHFLLWIADEEFPARLSVLFDRSVETHLQADAIWGIANWTCARLLTL